MQSLRPFWSFVEILGIVAVILPFVVHVSASSLETENGRVVHFVYRDWIAVVGGIAAILCGLAAAARFGSTPAAKRGLRVAVVLGLIGLGVLQELRGFGVTQSPLVADDHNSFDDPANNSMMRDLERQQAERAATAGPTTKTPPIDLAPQTRTILELWEGNKVHELYAMTSPALQQMATEASIAELIGRQRAALGTCGPLTPPIHYELVDNDWRASAAVQCGEFPLTLKIAFAITKGTALIDSVGLVNAVERPMTVADATTTARRFVDALIAADTSHFAEIVDLRVLQKLGDLDKAREQLRTIVADAGTIAGVKQTDWTSKNRGTNDFVFDVTGEKHHLTVTITTEFFMTRWFITSFNVAPADAAPKPP